MENGLVAEYSCAGTKVKIYSNRIEWNVGFSKKMISIKNISSIDLPFLLQCVDIKTNDGKKERIVVSLSKREEFRNNIMNLI